MTTGCKRKSEDAAEEPSMQKKPAAKDSKADGSTSADAKKQAEKATAEQCEWPIPSFSPPDSLKSPNWPPHEAEALPKQNFCLPESEAEDA